MSALHKVNASYTSSMEWLSVDLIESDPALQRPLDERWAQKIATNFDPDALGKPLVVEFARGRQSPRYVVLDGQHRLRAVQMALGDKQLIECEVVRGVSVAHAARLFVERNTFKRPQLIDVFLKNVTAGDEESVAICRIVEGFGLKIAIGGLDGYVNCVGALQKIYRGDVARGTGRNELALKRTLGTALQAWGRKAEAFHGIVLHGIGMVVLKHGDVLDFETLERKLAAFPKGPVGLLGKARGSRETMGGSLPHNVAGTIVREYNKGRRKYALPEWFTAA